MFSSYDSWRLATPPEYEWPADRCEDCGERCNPHPSRFKGCRCDDPPEYPDEAELIEFFDEADEARMQP